MGLRSSMVMTPCRPIKARAIEIPPMNQHIEAQEAPPGPVQNPSGARARDHDMRSIILTITMLLAATTYQAAINHPGGVWSEDDAPSPTACPPDAACPPAPERTTQVARTSILATKSMVQFNVFMDGNSLRFFFLWESLMTSLEDSIAKLS
ncbi:hypothetical protein K1719_042455 [Acacia pycnantha]|nr:hypothetical protein K1719_042455 [Acacia pycnantha]